MWESFEKICWYVGIFYITLFLISTVRRFTVWQKNLISRYNGGWAMVTGATDGIGLGFCEQLAKIGFNICMVSRSMVKLQKVSKQMKERFPKIEIKIVAMDFSQQVSTQFYDKLMDKIKDLDISILVNNVGIMLDVGPFCSNSFQQIKKQLTVNLFPIAQLIHRMAPKMLSRPSKSAIINLSSSAIYANLKGSAHYCSTKCYDDILSRSLEYEYAHKIDFLSVRPALVTTPLTRGTQSFLHVNKNQCAAGSLRSLGHLSWTSGHWWHELQALPIELLESQFLDMVLGKIQGMQGSIYKKIDESRGEK